MTDDGAPPARIPRWRRAVRIIALLLFVLFVALALRGQWDSVQTVVRRFSWRGLLLAQTLVALGLCTGFLSWRTILSDFGYRTRLRDAAHIFFVGQLGKYLPGSVWTALSQMELGRDYEVPRRVSGAAAVLILALTTATGLMTAVASLPWLGLAAFDDLTWVWATLPVMLVMLTPPVLNRSLGLALRLLRRDPMPMPASAGGVAMASLWLFATWGLFGLHISALARDLGTAHSGFAAAAGTFAVAWVAGFLFFIVPAGVGAREGSLLLMLAAVMTLEEATTITVVSRVFFILGDVALAGAALLASRGLRRARRGRSGSVQSGLRS